MAIPQPIPGVTGNRTARPFNSIDRELSQARSQVNRNGYPSTSTQDGPCSSKFCPDAQPRTAHQSGASPLGSNDVQGPSGPVQGHPKYDRNNTNKRRGGKGPNRSGVSKPQVIIVHSPIPWNGKGPDPNHSTFCKENGKVVMTVQGADKWNDPDVKGTMDDFLSRLEKVSPVTEIKQDKGKGKAREEFDRDGDFAMGDASAAKEVDDPMEDVIFGPLAQGGKSAYTLEVEAALDRIIDG